MFCILGHVLSHLLISPDDNKVMKYGMYLAGGKVHVRTYNKGTECTGIQITISSTICISYYTPDRSLPRIHEVIFNNPEGGARGLIEYY